MKKVRTKAEFDPREDEWEGDWDQLHGWEAAIADDWPTGNGPVLAERLFGSHREAFEVGWHLGSFYPPERAPGTADASGPRTWSAHNLYGKEAPARRIYFLELVAWAINRAESFHTKEEAKEFGEHLTETRKAVWGEGKPWRGAAHSGTAFLDHVRAMADVFAHAPTAEDALYPNRERQPLA